MYVYRSKNYDPKKQTVHNVQVYYSTETLSNAGALSILKYIQCSR